MKQFVWHPKIVNKSDSPGKVKNDYPRSLTFGICHLPLKLISKELSTSQKESQSVSCITVNTSL